MTQLQNSPRKNANESRIRFEKDIFLLFALRLVYRHFVYPPMVKNWIAKLHREVRAAHKGNRKRGRGDTIRFGKKMIYALFRKKSEEVSDLREGYTANANQSVNIRAQMYGSNQYLYSERRARQSLKIALNVFKRHTPIEKMPTIDDVEEERTYEELSSNTPPTAEDENTFNQIDDVTFWSYPFQRPSENALNELLANKCDDNFETAESDTDETPTAPSGQDPTSQQVTKEPIQSSKLVEGYLPGLGPEPALIARHDSGCKTYSRWARSQNEPERGNR